MNNKPESNRAKIARLKQERKERGVLMETDNPNAIDLFLPPIEDENAKQNEESIEKNDGINHASADIFEPYPNEAIRMKLHTGERRERLKHSIEISGVMEPVIAMPSVNPGKLITISGHNRVDICKTLGIEVPYILKIGLTTEEADLICIDTNLLNRQHDDMLPSDLGRLLKAKFDIIKNQGKRTDILDELPINTPLAIGQEYKLSSSNVKRYIRLCFLNKELLDNVDNQTLSLRAGVDLSYLKQDEQTVLADLLSKNKGLRIDITLSERLKKLSQAEKDSNIDILSILENRIHPKSKEKAIPKIKFKSKSLLKIESEIKEEDIGKAEDIILEGIRLYYARLNA